MTSRASTLAGSFEKKRGTSFRISHEASRQVFDIDFDTDRDLPCLPRRRRSARAHLGGDGDRHHVSHDRVDFVLGEPLEKARHGRVGNAVNDDDSNGAGIPRPASKRGSASLAAVAAVTVRNGAVLGKQSAPFGGQPAILSGGEARPGVRENDANDEPHIHSASSTVKAKRVAPAVNPAASGQSAGYQLLTSDPHPDGVATYCLPATA